MMYGSFSKSALDLWNFTRCQRPNGTFYGTRGKCRKGAEAGPKERGEFLGGGLEGKVYGVGRGRVLKISKDADPNLDAQRIASDAELAPRILAVGAMKSDPKQRKYQVIDRVRTEDISGIGQPGRVSKPIDELSGSEIRREKASYLSVLKLNSLGVEHGDIHGGNLKWDIDRNRPVLLDFDNARVDPRRAKQEARNLLNNAGIRLEEAGYYDEADALYSAARSRSKNFFQIAQEALEENFPDGEGISS